MENLGITVKELEKACKELIKNGYGDKHIQVTTDDEGNGYHSLFYLFNTKKEDIAISKAYGMLYGIKEKDLENIVLLG